MLGNCLPPSGRPALDARAWLKAVQTAAEEPGSGGLLVHVPAPGHTDNGASTAFAAVLSLALTITALRQPSDRDPAPGGKFV